MIEIIERRLITCRKPEHYRCAGGWELDNSDDERPVIAVLDPQKVFAALQGKGGHFVPVESRLERLMKICVNGYLELPDVRDGAFGGVVFQQGRHRTAALAKLGFTAYPVVTSDRDALSLLAKFGALVDDAAKHFDWTGITDYPVAGL